MSPVRLDGMTPAQHLGWVTLLDLSAQLADDWCLVGGQLVWLHAQEAGVQPPARPRTWTW